jgi:hypothetical protein
MGMKMTEQQSEIQPALLDNSVEVKLQEVDAEGIGLPFSIIQRHLDGEVDRHHTLLPGCLETLCDNLHRYPCRALHNTFSPCDIDFTQARPRPEQW